MAETSGSGDGGQTLYDEAGGSKALLRLAAAWHARCLDDEVLRHPFSHPGQNPEHLERLAAYWSEALGGPAAYTGGIADESHVVRTHAGNGEHADLDRRAVAAFTLALHDARIPERNQLHEQLTAYFAAATARLAAHPDSPDDVPDDLPLPHWARVPAASRH